jgi:hypothetical protein
MHTIITEQPQPERLTSGAITWTWCRAHMVRTLHVFRPGTPRPLMCLECHPEADPARAAKGTEYA